MRVAQVSTVWETTPPRLYGGTERVAAHLTDELVALGHQVTLFATGDSKAKGRLAWVVPKPLYRQGIAWNNFLYPLTHIVNVFEHADEFDIIHFHLNKFSDFPALAFAGLVKTPTVFTVHFVLPDKKDKERFDRYDFLHRYRHLNFVSISKAQRTMDLHYVGNVYHGLNFPIFKKPKQNRATLLWLGRVCKDKGTREAIQVAKRTGRKLILAGKVDTLVKSDQEYFKKFVKPFLDGRQITHIGEVNDLQKQKLFREACALLHPIKWNEPFGLVAIEAMGAGVPVIAFDRGPVREQVIPGKTGFIVNNVAEMAKKVPLAAKLDPTVIRQHAEERFSARAMALGYEMIYRRLRQIR